MRKSDFPRQEHRKGEPVLLFRPVIIRLSSGGSDYVELPVVAYHVVSVIIATRDAISASLAVTNHVIPVIVVTCNSIGASLAVTGHNAPAVVVTSDSIGSTLAKTSTHLKPLSPHIAVGQL